WRLGWSVCLATPYWPDGRVCELASREVLRRALDLTTELGYDVLAAFEYEIRIRDPEGRPLSSGISYSVGEVLRFDELIGRLNPTLSSYKRLVPGFFAPVNVSWGHENRSAAVRVIRSERTERTRIECRRPGADANPYLALAALAASAADGIRRGLAPPPPAEGDASARADLPPLPRSLESALRAFDDDGAFRAALGETFCD